MLQGSLKLSTINLEGVIIFSPFLLQNEGDYTIKNNIITHNFLNETKLFCLGNDITFTKDHYPPQLGP